MDARQHRNNFDLLRLIAAGMVVLTHGFEVYGRGQVIVLQNSSGMLPVSVGAFGVTIFFAISGYLVAASMEHSRLFEYMGKRALRLYPALALNFAVMLFILIPLTINYGLGEYYQRLWDNAPRNLKLLIGLRAPEVHGVYPGSPNPRVNASLWTLQYEAYCYLLVLIAGLIRFPKLVYPVILAAFWLYYAKEISWNYRVFDRGVQSIAVFFISANLYAYRRYVPWNGLVACGMVLALGHIFINDAYVMPVYMIATAYLTIYLGQHVRSLGNAARYGDLSYGIYIFSWPIQQTVAGMLLRQPELFWPYLFISTLLTLVMAFVSWHMVEAPALALKRKLRPCGGDTRSS